MSKLAQIRKALEENPDIVVIGAPEKNRILTATEGWRHSVDFYVTPKQGVYTVTDLQNLMVSLIPLSPTRMDRFGTWGNRSFIQFGQLYFEENIGTEVFHHQIVLTDEELFPTKGFTNGILTTNSSKKIQRMVWVKVYPNTRVAQAAMNGKHVYHISVQELETYKLLTQFAT